MTESAEPRARFLGIDVGGSSSRACLTQDPDAPRLWSLSGGSLALDRIAVRDLLLDVITETTPSAACFGIAGARTARSEVDWLKAELSQVSCPILVTTDAELALVAAFGTDVDGMVVCAGTGSVAVVRCRGVVHVIGGHGFLFDDGGSAYDIGRRLVSSALRDKDRGDLELVRELEVMLDESIDEFLCRVYANPADRQLISQLAEKVSLMKSAGAQQILVDAANSLSSLIRLAEDRFGQLPVRTAGGVFANHQIATTLNERFNASPVELRTEVAAARLAEGVAA